MLFQHFTRNQNIFRVLKTVGLEAKGFFLLLKPSKFYLFFKIEVELTYNVVLVILSYVAITNSPSLQSPPHSTLPPSPVLHMGCRKIRAPLQKCPHLLGRFNGKGTEQESKDIFHAFYRYCLFSSSILPAFSQVHLDCSEVLGKSYSSGLIYSLYDN